MMMKKMMILILAVMCASFAFGQQKVAVYVSGEEKGVNKILGDQLVAAFANSGKYNAIERTNSFLAELGKEQNYQRAGNVDDSELSRLGKQFGVQLVCVAEVSKVETFGKAATKDKYISARLIDVESAEVVNTANTSSSLSNMTELLKVSQKITSELTGKTAKERIGENEAKAREAKRIQDFKDNKYSPHGTLYVQNNPSSKVAWDIAEQICKNSTLGGFKDWRLPNIGELMQIYTFRDELLIYGFSKSDLEKEDVWSSSLGSNSKKVTHIILTKGKTKESKDTAVCHCVRDVKE